MLVVHLTSEIAVRFLKVAVYTQGPGVESWITANPGLEVNPSF
jgi:hypothetical protein